MFIILEDGKDLESAHLVLACQAHFQFNIKGNVKHALGFRVFKWPEQAEQLFGLGEMPLPHRRTGGDFSEIDPTCGGRSILQAMCASHGTQRT